jgi:BirA family biotin operon repressor/biotin-[acetyl-CoA-carboxylase] ligase
VLSTALLEQLAAGEPRPRAALAAAAGVDAAGLAAALAEIEATGLELVTGPGDAIGLSAPIHWISLAAVAAASGEDAWASVDRVDYRLQTESTNRSLLADGPPPPGRMRVAIAEHQSAGRGRRGRQWIMPPAAGLALSAAWTFESRPALLSALGLAVGAAARRALRELADIEVGLKWPNDLIVGAQKLGGILVELESLPGDACLIVAGIGINVCVPRACLERVGSDRFGATDLARALGTQAPDRSALAGRLLAHLLELFRGYAQTGFEPYRDEWLAAHVLADRDVELTTARGIELGRVRGIDADGALVLEDGQGGTRRVISGDVTVRVG